MAERLRVLVVDDEAPARRAIASFIARKGDVVREAEDGQAALSVLEAEEMDVVLSDVRMSKLDGLGLTRAVRARSEDTVVVLMTAFATIDGVIAAIREGAYDYILKPIDPDALSAALDRTRERLALRRRVRSLTAALSARDALAGLVAGGPTMREVLDAARRASQSDLPVLITGETGTGKDLLARAIHGLSPRASGPFVVVNAATMPEQDIEQELFGNAGATGAREIAGRIRAAERGTLFIDELGTMPVGAQARLLRLLEERVLDAQGAQSPVDVRIMTSAGEKLEEEVRTGRFRSDLFYKLRVIEIEMPPLRDRREDLPQLVEHFLHEAGEAQGVRYRITPEALSLLMAARWPGNVDELKSTLRAALAMARTDTIETDDLPPALRQNTPRTSTLAEQVMSYERAVLRQALESVKGQVGRAAAALGVPERTLRRKMRLFGLAKEAFRKPVRSRTGGGVFGAS